jgi:hypothetical protein
VGEQNTENQVRRVGSGIQVPGVPDQCRAEQDPFGDLIAEQLFSFKCPSIAPAEIGNISR